MAKQKKTGTVTIPKDRHQMLLDMEDCYESCLKVIPIGHLMILVGKLNLFVDSWRRCQGSGVAYRGRLIEEEGLDKAVKTIKAGKK